MLLHQRALRAVAPERSLLLSVVVAMTTGHQLQQPATTRLLGAGAGAGAGAGRQ